MHRTDRGIRRVLPLLPLLLVAACAPAATAERISGPAACEIRAAPAAGGGVALTALARSGGRGGSYSFRVAGRGTNIRQGGEFGTAATGKAATVGAVTLDTGGAALRADLDVTVHGETVSCTRRVGGGS